ncbi:type II toxin-antitoxin system VapC family toxin [Rhizobium sp. LjRoot30]|uniref:type II toxin-antitoxin system VapC family toxin n=1 Tax=Rhizobium sp. LjRoot30 TaxID=3342320 RepID=UPI003ED0FA31
MYLLDTNVLSVTAPARANDPQQMRVKQWLDRASAAIFLSSITVAEIENGIAKAERTGAVRKAEGLARWLDLIIYLYGERIIPVDVPIAKTAGRLLDQAVGRGGNPGFEDAAIAATAQQHELTVVSRNARHFMLMDVAFIDPHDQLPSD